MFQNLYGESYGNVLDGFHDWSAIRSIIQGPLADKFGPQAVVLVMGFSFLDAALNLRISGKSETYNFKD